VQFAACHTLGDPICSLQKAATMWLSPIKQRPQKQQATSSNPAGQNGNRLFRSAVPSENNASAPQGRVPLLNWGRFMGSSPKVAGNDHSKCRSQSLHRSQSEAVIDSVDVDTNVVPALRSALGRRGGVVRRADAFEVFYGLVGDQPGVAGSKGLQTPCLGTDGRTDAAVESTTALSPEIPFPKASVEVSTALSPATALPQAHPVLLATLGQRGGVLRKSDGYELFYGLVGDQPGVAPPSIGDAQKDTVREDNQPRVCRAQTEPLQGVACATRSSPERFSMTHRLSGALEENDTKIEW